MSAAVTVAGEALVDLVERPGQPPVAYPGGGPANVAVGLGRLGLAPVLVTALGDDAHGDLVRAHLADSGVRVLPAGRPGEPTSTATARLDEHGAASYEFDLTWTVRDLALADDSRALYVGSLGLALDPGAGAVLDLVDRVSAAGEVAVCFDPNIRPSLTPDRVTMADRVERVAAASDLVKLSLDDLRLLFGDAEPAAVARRWLAGRTSLVVVTLGSDGALAVTADAATRFPPYPVDTADTVGAGDTFMAGLIAALADLDGMRPAALAAAVAVPDTLRRVLRQAAGAAAVTCSRPGADPPSRAELDAFLAAAVPVAPLPDTR